LDITFPKAIQALFARELEANLRAKIELENARTIIATTRALKNAAAIIKDDKEMKFLQVMELLQNAVKTGKNTLNVSEILAE
jgi:SPFH/Band 7/PHB domain protein